MKTKTLITRSLARTTIGVHRQIEARREEVRHGQWCEREQQFQYDFSGQISDILPGESTINVLFDIVFAFDAGAVRDSQLGPPLFRHGFEFTSAAPFMVGYAHVSSWIQDESFNYVGAVVTLGVHSQAPTGRGASFAGTLHLSFQGWGAPLDPDMDTFDQL